MEYFFIVVCPSVSFFLFLPQLASIFFYRYLAGIADGNVSIAIPMRMLEIFLSPATYDAVKLGPDVDSQKLVSQLMRNLINAGDLFISRFANIHVNR